MRSMAASHLVAALRPTLICLCLLSDAARAHSQSGSLASSAASTDLYQIVCSDDAAGTPRSLSVQILDTSPGALPVLSVQAHRNLGLRNASDTITADATPSPRVAVNEGAGSYDVLVNKSGAGLKYYSLIYHCASEPDGGGTELESSLILLQDQ